MNTVILTGFAGFIGSQLLRDLVKKYKVIGIDNLSEGSDVKNYKKINKEKFFPIYADISDKNLKKYIDDVVKNNDLVVDYVINCAAQSHVDRSFDQYDIFIKSNVSGPVNLAKIALDYKVKKFVQVSTDEVFADSNQPFTEDSKITPQNAYSSSKAAAEMLLYNYQRAFGLPLVITNGANTYGPRQKEKIIPKAVDSILRKVKIPLYKTPARRMWLHVEDHSSGIIKAMLNGEIGERYCLAPSEEDEFFTHDLLDLICYCLGVNYEDVVELVEDRPNYDLRYYMLNHKATKDLVWSPNKKIKDEISKVVNWYVENFKK